jgi:hypothetical protein
MSVPHVLLLGAGSLGSALALGLAVRSLPGALRLTIAAREIGRAHWAARVAQAHADAAGCPARIGAVELDWDDDALVRTLVELAPDVIVLAASPQSAWSLDGLDDWSALVARCGYAVTAALQLSTATKLQAALTRTNSDIVFVNACYPDLLNALLASAAPAPLCGLGNVALVAEGLRQHLAAGGRLRMLAGHADVGILCGAAGEREDLPPVWIDAERVPEEAIQTMPALVNKPSLNLFNAAPSAALLEALAFGTRLETHVPGPLGLPGGYPVVIDGRSLQLDLPAGMSQDSAVAWNHARSWKDGAAPDPESGALRFSDNASAALRPFLPEFADGFALADFARAGAAFLELRRRLGGGGQV